MKKYIGIYILMLLLASCGGGDAPDSGTTVSSDFIKVLTNNITLDGDGGSADITIEANCSWTINSSSYWLRLSSSTGFNNQKVSVSAEKNTSGAERNAVLIVSGGKARSVEIRVSQPKGTVELKLSVSTTSLEFESKGETKTFTINANTSWTISKPDWCTVDKTSGTGDATISVTVSENKDKEKRTGNIIINGEGVSPVTITINQKEREAGNSEPGSGDNTPPSV